MGCATWWGFDIFPIFRIIELNQADASDEMDFISIAVCGFLTILLNIISGFLIYFTCKKFALKVQNDVELQIRAEKLYISRLKQNIEEYLKQSFKSQKREHQLVKKILKK